jgi:hypothetical protein
MVESVRLDMKHRAFLFLQAKPAYAVTFAGEHKLRPRGGRLRLSAPRHVLGCCGSRVVVLLSRRQWLFDFSSR